MGLYIIKNLCNKLGHNIYIKSEENKYTNVVIEFGKNKYYKF
jgi:signal transduction histidine kinase